MRRRVLTVGFLACLALAATPHPRLLLNTTASVPVGLYRLAPVGKPRVGDLVVVRPDPALAAFLAEGGWLPRGVPLLKPVAAIEGQSVCRMEDALTIDGRQAVRTLSLDGRGRPLPRWSGCRRLGAGEVLLLAPARASLDGRYFGVTNAARILARAEPLLIDHQEPER